MVTATTSEASRLKVTVRAWSRKSCPAMPSTKTMGRNTATVVRVEATTAPPTSAVPLMAAAYRDCPICFLRKIDSSTTIELSTSMPMPRVNPPSDMMFSEMSSLYMATKVATTEMGMLVAMIRVLRRSRRNSSSTTMASSPPISAALRTSLTACSMKWDWSNSTVRLVPGGSLPSCQASMRSCRRRATVTELASPSL